MKNIKIILIIAICFTPVLTTAQAEVRDEVLAGLKGAVAVQIAGLDVEKKLIENSYKELAKEEQKWRDKLDVVIDPNIASIYGGAVWRWLLLSSRISTVESQITTLEATPPFYHRGLKELKAALAREKVYLSRVQDDMSIFTIPELIPRVSGGQGYSYTFSMKLYYRILSIASRVEKIKYKVDNLNVFVSAFY